MISAEYITIVVDEILDNKQRTQTLYKLSENLPEHSYQKDIEETPYFIVSRVFATDHYDYESAIFASDEEGSILSYADFWMIRGYEETQVTVDSYLASLNGVSV